MKTQSIKLKVLHDLIQINPDLKDETDIISFYTDLLTEINDITPIINYKFNVIQHNGYSVIQTTTVEFRFITPKQETDLINLAQSYINDGIDETKYNTKTKTWTLTMSI